MHEKLGDAFAQRANADEAWHEYSHALQLMKEDPQVDRNELLCLYTRLAELSTRWLGWFNTPPDMLEMRSYIDAGLNLLEGQPPSGDLAAFFTYQAMRYTLPMKSASAHRRTDLAEQALRSGQDDRRIAAGANVTSALC